MTGESVECFNCGRANPSWAQVCRSCGVPMRPGGAGAKPPSGRLPRDRDSLVSIGAALATIGGAIVFGLVLSGMLPEAPAVIPASSPTPSASVAASASEVPASASSEPSAEATPELIGTLTFGRGLNQSTREVIDQADTFGPGTAFCHSLALPKAVGVAAIQEEVLRIGSDGSLEVVQRRKAGTLPVDPSSKTMGFCADADLIIGGWGAGDYMLRDYRRKAGSPQLLAQGRFTLTE